MENHNLLEVEPDDSNLDELLFQLTNLMKESEKNCKFLDAQAAQTRIQDLKILNYERKRSELEMN